jgi:hypothetical protein
MRIFLLSPAHCGGERARMIRSATATFDLARRLRSREGAPLGDVFTFLSGLYFRGKLTYARAFAAASAAPAAVLVITSSDGLRLPEHPITIADLERYAAVPIASDEGRYRDPLLRDARRVARAFLPAAEIVLLGSVATAKYTAVLNEVFGDALRFPRAFLGRGDMSRGALLLQAVRAGRELDYAAIPPVPHRRAVRSRRSPRCE